MSQTKTFESESRLSFLEAMGIIVGHGVGAGILSVPFLASKCSWYNFAWIMILATLVSALLHLMIAELSYNNNGAMFVKCIENLFKPKAKKAVSIIAGICLGFSVLSNCCAYVSGGGVAIQGLFSIFGITLNKWLGALIFYLLCALVVFFGMKLVGICEKYCVFAMIAILVLLFGASLLSETHYSLFLINNESLTTIMGLFGMVSFALSAVMSAPQVVKGLNGNVKKINFAIIGGIVITAILIVILTITTVMVCPNVTNDGAINDLSGSLGGWVGIVGYLFSIFALATSFWANTLDLRDIVHEQANLSLRLSWLLVSAPCLLLSIVVMLDFVNFTAAAGAIQVVTALGIVVAFSVSRKRVGDSPMIKVFGTIPFQIFVLVFNLLATIGEIIVMLG